MGLYDCNCMVTGVSLLGADTALILLYQSAGKFIPSALAIKGNYNRAGSIDGIEEDANSRLVLRFFRENLRTGVFSVDEHYLRGHRCFPIRDIEVLLHGFERNINDNPRAATFKGQRVVFALIAQAVWDTIATTGPQPPEPIVPVFQRLFPGNSIGAGIYSGSLGAVSDQIYELAMVDQFLTKRGLPWQPSRAGGQDDTETMLQYLEEARRTFCDSAMILAALQRHETEVFKDDCKPFRPITLDPNWLTSTVLALANGIDNDRAFDRLPILADALQDAGCANAEILNHCRAPDEHVRRCGVVDLLLGKQ